MSPLWHKAKARVLNYYLPESMWWVFQGGCGHFMRSVRNFNSNFQICIKIYRIGPNLMKNGKFNTNSLPVSKHKLILDWSMVTSIKGIFIFALKGESMFLIGTHYNRITSWLIWALWYLMLATRLRNSQFWQKNKKGNCWGNLWTGLSRAMIPP